MEWASSLDALLYRIHIATIVGAKDVPKLEAIKILSCNLLDAEKT